jgi:four helix bundle protein
MTSYRDLEIWKLARQLSVKVHRMTLTELPKFELYEEGSQIRRASKSIRHNIVEGYGRRRYKHDFVRFLTFAIASCDETTDVLETLRETESLRTPATFEEIASLADELGRKLNRFIQSVERQHRSEK